MVLFETVESVIEALWDIALCIYILQAAFAYFLLSFGSTVALSCLLPDKLLDSSKSLPLSAIFFCVYAICAILIGRYIEVPRTASFRAVVGGVALCFMLPAQLLTATFFREEAPACWLRANLTSGILFTIHMLGFALLPALLVVVDRKPRDGDRMSPSRMSEKNSAEATGPEVG